jgi:hypothetical protein
LIGVKGDRPIPRYILRYHGNGAKPGDVAARLRSTPGVMIIDETPRMILVEASDDSAIRLIASSPSWLVAEERFTPLPDARHKVLKRFIESGE